MIEPVILDYEGEPVYFDNGELYEAIPPFDCDRGYTGEFAMWNPETLEWEFDNSECYGESLEELEMRCYYEDRLPRRW